MAAEEVDSYFCELLGTSEVFYCEDFDYEYTASFHVDEVAFQRLNAVLDDIPATLLALPNVKEYQELLQEEYDMTLTYEVHVEEMP